MSRKSREPEAFDRVMSKLDEAKRQQDAPVKLCVNCVNCAPLVNRYMCTAPEAVSLVTGEPLNPQCYEMRGSGWLCGPSGKLFTPRAQ